MSLQSLADADCIVIMGSNMAENHPVGFRFVMQAKERGATIIHVDPRFSRTSAMADLHVPIRPGSDLVFLGALARYAIENDKYFKEYVTHYTNASAILNSDFKDTEDLAGIFSGFDAETRQYDTDTWRYDASNRDLTLQDPQCIFQVVRRHFSRYTPEVVEQICGVPADLFLKAAEIITENSGRERTTSFCYAVAWTQHTNGSQTIGCAALLQLLLGNVGRPGGGIMALRGHATIQGSTDIPTLFDLLPGYLATPLATPLHADLQSYIGSQQHETGWWYELPKYMVSLLKAWYGDAATAENDYAYDLMPKVGGDYSFLMMIAMMNDGELKGLFNLGMNPAVGGQNTRAARAGLRNLDWLVVRDGYEIESAAFWYDAPEVKNGEVDPHDIKTEVFLLPAALAAEKTGSFTNTQRLVQWHDAASEAPGDCRSENWFIHELWKRLVALYEGEDSTPARQLLSLHWPYSTDDEGEPEIEEIVKEINGYRVDSGEHVTSFTELEADGSTACGCWIYSGIMPAPGLNLAKRRQADDMASLEWGYAWPANRRILYNRASADPDGNPWSERKRWVWWDEEQGHWTGHDVPDFPATKRPDFQPEPDAVGIEAHAGDAPFIMMDDGRGQLFVSKGLLDGPLPTHYEPRETPITNLLYPEMQNNPVAKELVRADNQYHDVGDPRFPAVLTTYRLTEHLTAGGMSRTVPWLAELQPEEFVEISTEHAAEIGVSNGEWVTITTLRAEVEARALVTDRMQPLTVGGKRVHQVGMPWHFGFSGLVTGAIANDLVPIIEDPNSLIHEAKALTCNVRAGRLAHRSGDE